MSAVLVQHALAGLPRLGKWCGSFAVLDREQVEVIRDEAIRGEALEALGRQATSEQAAGPTT